MTENIQDSLTFGTRKVENYTHITEFQAIDTLTEIRIEQSSLDLEFEQLVIRVINSLTDYRKYQDFRCSLVSLFKHHLKGWYSL
jgi:hypothetical protein